MSPTGVLPLSKLVEGVIHLPCFFLHLLHFYGDLIDMQATSLHDSQLQLFANLNGHSKKVSTCTFSTDGQWLASAGIDKKVLIWSVATKELKCTIDGPEGHTLQVNNARFCSDDRLILGTTSYDQTVRIWDLAPLAQGTSLTAKSISALKGHHAAVSAMDFCPMIGSNRCVSCDFDGELRVWNFMTGECERVINKMVCVCWNLFMLCMSKGLWGIRPIGLIMTIFPVREAYILARARSVSPPESQHYRRGLGQVDLCR